MCHHNLRGLVLVDGRHQASQGRDCRNLYGLSPGQTETAVLRPLAGAQLRALHPAVDARRADDRARQPGDGLRLCWRPYLHNLSLPHYLRRVPTPTLIVWGRQDAIVPLECGELFQQALPNATLKVIEHCGHSPAMRSRRSLCTW